MGIFSTGEHADLDRSAAQIDQIREMIRRDLAARQWQPASESPAASEPRPAREGEVVSGQLDSMLERVAGTSVQDIDAVIAELKILRRTLHDEAARLERELIQYATLSQAALQSTKIIAESVANWRRLPVSSRMSA
jgi:hypothetical protein